MFQYSEKDLDIYMSFIEDNIGAIDYMFDVEGADNEVLCQIIVLKKQEKNGVISNKFLTLGLSEKLMEDNSITEVIFDLPGEIKDEGDFVEDQPDQMKFLMYWLLHMKDVVTFRGGDLLPGVTVEAIGGNHTPYPQFDGGMIFPSEEVWRIGADSLTINALHFIGLYSEELTFKNKEGPIELLKRIYHFGEPFPLDFNRPNTCIGKVKELKIRKQDIKRILDDPRAYKECLVSDSIMVEGNKVGVCIKEDAIGEGFSGWTFLSGLEDEEYLYDLENFDMYSVQHLLNYDKEVELILDSQPPVNFVRDENGIFVAVEECWQKKVLENSLERNIGEGMARPQGDFEYDGAIHMYKVGAKGLNTEEINGLTHLAIYVRAMIELGFLSEDVDENIARLKEDLLKEGCKYKLREYIRDNFNAMLPYEIFNEEGKLFTRRYLEEAYTQEVDVYTKKRYVDEGRDPKDAQTEEYLFISYDEDYYEHMKKWIEEQLVYFNEVILSKRKEGKLSLDIVEKVKEMEAAMDRGEDVEYVEIYTFIMDELFKKSEDKIFDVEEIFTDSQLMSEIGEYIFKEDSFEAMMLLITIANQGFADAVEKNNGRWFHIFGYALLRRGFVLDALDFFEEGMKADEDYVMNWYYFAILSFVNKSRGKESFGKAMEKLSSLREKPYLVEVLIRELKEGIHDPQKLILHMDSEEEDKILYEKLSTGARLDEKEFKRLKLSETMVIDGDGADNIKFIFDGKLKETTDGEVVVSLPRDEELELVFNMSKGVFSQLNNTFIENLNLALAFDEYKKIAGFDKREYKLSSVIVDERYRLYLRYVCEAENISCVLTLNKDDFEAFVFPKKDEIKGVFDETLEKFLEVYKEEGDISI